ncbi:MAG: hypothetical protein FJY25_18245 [Betaproteobacteria bacterium]|nr:hypothetical protein [Betaproteobacteria bacterium]
MSPVEKAVAIAMPRLRTLEGVSFEKLIRALHSEMSRKGCGDFEVSDLKLGYWKQIREHRRLAEWTHERVLFSPAFTAGVKAPLAAEGYWCIDLNDYAALI